MEGVPSLMSAFKDLLIRRSQSLLSSCKISNQSVPPRGIFGIVNLNGLHIGDHLLFEESLFRLLPKFCLQDYNVSKQAFVALMLLNHPSSDIIGSSKLPHRLANTIGRSGTPSLCTSKNSGNFRNIPSLKTAINPTTVVLGLSGKPQTVIEDTVGSSEPIFLIRRYTGGGTVLVDKRAVICSLILPHCLTGVKPYPKDVMEWTYNEFYSHQLYNPLFKSTFCLHESDYALHEFSPSNGETNCLNKQYRKVGGNAQAFSRHYVVHHTSFLWDTNTEDMERILPTPSKQPKYRVGRRHSEFLTSIREALVDDTIQTPLEFMHALNKHAHLVISALNKRNEYAEQLDSSPILWDTYNFDVQEDSVSGFSWSMSQGSDSKICISLDDCRELVSELLHGSVKHLRSTFFMNRCGERLPDICFTPFSRLLS
ncbi:hypothetical protein IE077_004591 [Cardiosporidium cionae]|uniref:BPL/LPL catalytic domain-containing protein n=1 Tax=Cardiosporidium cionae TaxID=476202 RepID=A0ABQ7J7B4_9APIC|nr:hypothetical protein IE077_004591 [Cardiosporidium cionae]|eukprot:KAF8819877.1 hypothetical protein IE077_004591 [Cardiosporidium cionae]